MTPASRLTQRLALVAVLILALQGLFGMARTRSAMPQEVAGIILFSYLFAFALWSLFLWRLWKSPRRWSLGLGIFFIFMLVFQTYLWHAAVTSTTHLPRLDYSPVRFALYEIPLVAAIILCFLLRRQLSRDNRAQ